MELYIIQYSLALILWVYIATLPLRIILLISDIDQLWTN